MLGFQGLAATRAADERPPCPPPGKVGLGTETTLKHCILLVVRGVDHFGRLPNAGI